MGKREEQAIEKKPCWLGSSARRSLAVFLLSCLVYGWRLGSFGLIARGEPRYAAIAREMWRSGDYITPRLNGLIYLEKPPMLFWMTAASVRLLGENELALRLPTMLCAALCTTLVYAWAEGALGLRSALLATSILMSSLLWLVMARHLRFDLPLSVAITGTLACCWWASEAGQSRRHYYYAAAACLAFGVLLKGPVALALVGLTWLLYCGLSRRWGTLLDVPWPGAIALFGLLVVPWYVACERAHPGAMSFFLARSTIWRVAREATHPQPWWHTFAFLMGAILPWSWALPGALRDGWRAWRKDDTAAGRLMLLALLWSGVTVAIYIPPPVKFVQYILPAVPALALLIGRHLAENIKEGHWSLLGTALFLLAVAAGLAGAARRFLPQTGLPIAEGYRWAALLAVGAAISLWAEAKQTREKAVVALAAAFGLALLSTYSQTERQPPYLITERPVIRAATRWAKPGQPLLCYGYLPLSALYYYPYRVLSVGPLPMEYIFPGNVSRWRDVWRPYEETEALLQSRPGWLGLAKEKDWRVLQARWPEHVRLLERVPPYVIFATMPAPGAKKAAPFFSSPKGRPQAKEQKRP